MLEVGGDGAFSFDGVDLEEEIVDEAYAVHAEYGVGVDVVLDGGDGGMAKCDGVHEGEAVVVGKSFSVKCF